MSTNDNLYILGGADGRQVLPTPSRDEWTKMFEASDSRKVAVENCGDVRVSTVFLGIDHNFTHQGDPIVFETMVFGGPLDEEMERCSTWEQAEAQHAAMVKRVKEAQA